MRMKGTDLEKSKLMCDIMLNLIFQLFYNGHIF